MSNKEILLRLWQIIRPYRLKLLISMFCMVFVALFTGAQTYMVKDLIDKIFIARNEYYLFGLTILIVIIFAIKGVFYYSYNYLLSKVGLSVIRDFRSKIFHHIHLQPLSFFNTYPTGTLISRVISDVTLIQQSVSNALVGILKDSFTVIVLLGVIFYLNWKLALFCLGIFPVTAVPLVLFGRIFRRLSTNTQEETAQISNTLYETITGNRIVKAFNKEAHENERYNKQLGGLFAIQVKNAMFNCLQHPMMEFIGGIIISLFIWFGGKEVIDGNTTPGTFFSLMTSMIVCYEPLKKIGKVNAIIQEGLAAAARVFSILEIKPEISDRPGASSLPDFHNCINFRNVTFTYNDETTALSGINLEVPRGQNLAIVGPSGGGKTTLSNLIPRFLDVTSGAITIDDKDIRDITMSSLRDQIAMVTQQTILFNDTVRNNIAYGREESSDEDIENAAIAAHAYNFIQNLPSGLDTIIGEGGARLSGGERQRISIARALLKNAPILILDEATSALDTESEREVQRALENLMKNRTTFVIAHRLSTIKTADRIIVIKGGRIVEDGTHDELLDLRGEYEQLYNMQYN